MTRKLMNKKIIIGLDLDGVILDHSLNKVELAKQFGFDITLADTPSDIMEKKISQDADIYASIKAKLYDDVKIARKTPLMPRAKEGLHFIKSTGLPYVLISRRRASECALITLKMHGLWPDYFDNSNTFFVSEKKDKDIKAKAIGVTHFVDDEPSVIAELASVPQKFLFDPLGSYKNLEGDFYKIQSWDELLQMLD